MTLRLGLTGLGVTRTRGFSLVEVLISITMLGGLLGTMLMVVLSGSAAASTGMARQSIEGAARRALDRIAGELVSAGAETLDPDPLAPWGSSNLTFQPIDGFDGDVVWGDPRSFGLALEEGELDDSQTTTATAWSTSASSCTRAMLADRTSSSRCWPTACANSPRASSTTVTTTTAMAWSTRRA